MYLLLVFCLGFFSSWGQSTIKTEPVIASSKNSKSVGQPKTFAVLIGVNDYSFIKTDSNLPNLKFAQKDVEDFKVFLENQYGEENIDIKVFTNANATYQNILTPLRDATKEGGKNYERVIFMFSGHAGTDDIESENSYLYLNKNDSRNEEQTGAYKYSMKYLRKDIYNLLEEGKVVIVILDACHSGALHPDRIYSTIDSWEKDSLSVNFLACLKDEKALEIDNIQNGLLIHYFIKGAEKEADFDLNNKVNVKEMRAFLSRVIPEAAQKNKHKQTPQVIANNDNITISIVKHGSPLIGQMPPNMVRQNEQTMVSPIKNSFSEDVQKHPLADSSKIIEEKLKKTIENNQFNDAYQLLIKFKKLDSTKINYQRLKYDYVGALHNSSIILSGELVDFVIANFFDENFKDTLLLFEKNKLKLETLIGSLTNSLSILDEKEPAFEEIKYRLLILEGLKAGDPTLVSDAIKMNPDIAYPYLFLAKINFDKRQNVKCFNNINEYEELTRSDKRIKELKDKLSKITANSSEPVVISKSENSTISIEKIEKSCKGSDYDSRTRIAVGSFDTQTKDADGKFAGELSSMLSNALVSTECFQVLASTTSNAMRDMQSEKEFNRNGDVRDDASVKEGQMMGAQLLVIGELTEFSVKETATKVAGLGVRTKQAKIGFILQIANPQTRQIIFSQSINVESAAVGEITNMKIFGVPTTNKNSNSRAMVDAIEKAIIKSVELIVAQKDKIQAMPQVAVPARNTEKKSVIEIENIDFAKLTTLTNFVKTYSKVKDATRSLKENKGSITVFHEGSIDELAEFLINKASDFEIVGLENGRIELKIVKK